MPSLKKVIQTASRGADLYFVFRFLRLLTAKYTATNAYKLGIIDKKGKPLKKSSDLTTSEEKSSYTMLHRLTWKIRGLIEKIPLIGKSILLNYAAALFLLKEQKDPRIWTDEGYMKRKLMEFIETDWEANAQLLKEEVDNMEKKSFQFLRETAVETEASTYRDRTKEDEKKKKRHFAFGGKKKSRHGESGYGKGEEVEVDEVESKYEADIAAYKKKGGKVKKLKPDKPFKSKFSKGYKAKKLPRQAEEVEMDEASKLPPHLAKFFDKDGNLKKDAADRIAKGRAKLNWKDVTPKGYGPKEEVEIDEAKGTAYPATVDTLRKIVKDKQNQVVMFKKGQARVDLFTASAMVQVYDAMKPATKKKFEEMIKDKAGFMKTQAFAMKMMEDARWHDNIKEGSLTEMKWEAGVVYHQDYGNGERTYFRADSVQKNKRWKGMSVDEIGGKQKKAKNNTADEKVQGWETTPKNEIPKGLKEEVQFKSFSEFEEEVELDEMFFKITIPDLPPVFVEGDSGSKIRRSMKLKLRPDVYKDLDVERVSRADMAKKYRSLAKAEKEKEEEDEVKEGLDEVAPPGWEGTVKKMKGDKNIDNPWALAWWMKSKGYKSNANEEVWYREQNALEEDFVTNRMGGGNIEYRSPLLFSKKKQKLVKRKYPAGTMMAYEEVELTEALKPADKKVIDAFYKENSLVGKLLSSTGKSLEKHGVGGQTIAAWLKGKIAITAVSDVKSTESILNYMKKSIPKNNFDPKSYKKFFEEVEVAEAKMSDPMIAKLKQKYEPLRGKRLSLGQNTEIAKIVSGMGKDKEVLLQLVKADIPFISLNAATFLMDKHGMKAKDINLGNKLVRKQEIKSKIIDDSYHGTFAGNDVFIVNSDTFHTCRLGKQKYHRYEKYVGNGKIGQAIREFGLTNPKKPIILQNGEGGPMLYLRYGGSKRYA